MGIAKGQTPKKTAARRPPGNPSPPPRASSRVLQGRGLGVERFKEVAKANVLDLEGVVVVPVVVLVPAIAAQAGLDRFDAAEEGLCQELVLKRIYTEGDSLHV
jgi:hypothetical protein